jgi:bifunctional non-homologous end joining protein LigD
LAIGTVAAELPDAIIDGKICASTINGASDFAALQAALAEGKTGFSCLFGFELLFAGKEIENSSERKDRLKDLLSTLDTTSNIRFVEH